jgi:type I restriction enzyme S subunit
MSFIVDNFAVITKTNEHIQELKLMTLDLAFQGKLVSQNQREQPAIELLKTIKAEKARLVKIGKIRKGKSLKPISEEEQPYKVPNGWTWCRLGNIIDLISGQHIVNSEYNGNKQGVPYLTGPSDFGDRNPIFSKWTEKPKVLSMKGDILITVKGSGVGKVNVLHEDNVAIGRQLMAIRKISLPEEFLLLYLKTKYHQLQSIKVGIAIPGISREDILNMKLPLPPLPEQHRIVQKVNTLFQQIDHLAESSDQAEHTRERLRRVLLHRLEQAPTQLETEKAWLPLQDQFDLAIRTVEDVQALRQTILQLAVKGQLVAQDPKDEHASVLLERIKNEKDRLVKEGKIRKQKKLPPISEEEVPFEVPEGWVWCRLNELGYLSGGGTPSRSKSEYWNGDILWVTPKDMKVPIISDSELKITQEGVENSSAKLIPQGSILIVARSGILKRLLPVSINSLECTVNQDIKVIIPYLENISKYIQLMLKGYERYILEKLVKGGTTVQSLKYDQFQSHPFLLPPLDEQRRIVAKVERLLEWCDELEANITQKKQKSEKLVSAALNLGNG